MPTLRIPSSGLMLVSHLAAYGLGAALSSSGERAFLGYDPSPELEPRIETNATAVRVAGCVRQTATDCERVVQADLYPGRPVIWARSTNSQRGPEALQRREALLDEDEATGRTLAAELAAGLGAPAAWLANGKPSWGASQLDGVAGNSTSDFVRGVLRRTLPAAREATAEQLEGLWLASDPAPPPGEADRTGWAPPGVPVHPLHQWLATLGLTQLPVALAASERSRTPCFWWGEQRRGVRLPVPRTPISTPRLRALLQSPELTAPELSQIGQARLRSLGVEAVLEFPLMNKTTGNMVQFAFGRAHVIELT